MFTRTISRALFSATVALMFASSAHAQDSSAALQELARKDQPFQSRTCGLVLLSSGRAQVRDVKAKGGNALEPVRAQLVSAFLLLRDGRNLQGGINAPREYFWHQLSTGTATTPKYQALPAATRYCEQWLDARRPQPDFDQGVEARYSAQAQADLTVQME